MMKKLVYVVSILLAGLFFSCGGGTKKAPDTKNIDEKKEEATTTVVPAANGVPEYTVIEKPQVDISQFPKDEDGFITIFDGKTFNGWRGYGKDVVPKQWSIEDGAIKFSGSGGGEAQEKDGGDIIFAYKFKNFDLELEWKISKGGNSGIFYLAQEIQGQPIYISSPEYQVLDNANHPDATQGVNGNRQAGSLYDMISATPQNANPFDEWNKTCITVYKGSVFHKQNDVTVLEYHLWTSQWTEMLQNSKFSQQKWHLAFELLNNLGGTKREGYIGFQDHGDDVWFRNIRIKIRD
jgi:hypothetical protein